MFDNANISWCYFSGLTEEGFLRRERESKLLNTDGCLGQLFNNRSVLNI